MSALNIQPHNPKAIFRLDGYLTWCGTVTRCSRGLYHLFASVWPIETGHDGWVTHSKVVQATADNPLGPFTYVRDVLTPLSDKRWDRDVAHNPTIIEADGLWYLYYMGTYGNGEFWNNRNNQRIGVAVASDPSGEFIRVDKPVLDVGAKGAWDDLMCSNPSCTRMPDGRFLMIYKAVSSDGSAPAYGAVRHGVAFADAPTGPFIKQSDPIFTCDNAQFAAEDPFVWCQDNKFYCILKDMGNNFSAHERALIIFESKDGIDWSPAEDHVLMTRSVTENNGHVREYNRLERAQLYIENGQPQALYLAAKPQHDQDESYNIHLRVS